jgi:hypothetical protein
MEFPGMKIQNEGNRKNGRNGRNDTMEKWAKNRGKSRGKRGINIGKFLRGLWKWRELGDGEEGKKA